jgi:tetratricopeptide (TPR) repeat protein
MAVLALTPSLFAQNPTEKPATIAIPGVKGALKIDVGPTAWDQAVRSDGKEVRLAAMDRADHLLISAFLQHVAFPASAERCRSEWWPLTRKAKVQRSDLDESIVKNGIARVEFIIPEYNGAKVRQKNVHAYVGGGDLCAEVHLSKVQFKPEDQGLFEDVLATVRLLPEEPPLAAQKAGPNSMALVGEGSQSYLRKDYKEAAVLYQRALDLEKQHRTLNPTIFRVLVDNLGMSYGIRGELAKSKEIFEYGIAQDPEYPLFYYNLACTYAEMGRLDDSLNQLRLAYKYKGNMIPGEVFPDPFKDDSFRKFVKDPKFLQAVHEMQQR